LDLGGITGKLEGNADKIGYAIGFLAVPSAISGGNPIGHYQAILGNLMQHPHLPDFGAVIANLTGGGSEESKFFMGGIEAFVIGWVLEQIDIHPTIARIGRFAKKAGLGTATATAAFTVLEYAGSY
jgi:hypothetical protein